MHKHQTELVGTQRPEIKNKCLHLVKAYESWKAGFSWQQEPTYVAVCYKDFWNGYDAQIVDKCIEISPFFRGIVIPSKQEMGGKGKNWRGIQSLNHKLKSTLELRSVGSGMVSTPEMDWTANTLLPPLQLEESEVTTDGQLLKESFIVIFKGQKQANVRKSHDYETSLLTWD